MESSLDEPSLGSSNLKSRQFGKVCNKNFLYFYSNLKAIFIVFGSDLTYKKGKVAFFTNFSNIYSKI